LELVMKPDFKLFYLARTYSLKVVGRILHMA